MAGGGGDNGAGSGSVRESKPLPPANKAFFFSLLVVLLAFIPAVVEFAFRIQFPTHRHGAVLITGASKGIGRDAVDALLEDGYVVFAGVRKQEDVDALEAVGHPALKPIILDVTDEGSIQAAYDKVVEELQVLNKPFTALINNAGIGPSSPVEFHDLKDARSIYDTNFFGVLAITQKFLPLIRQTKSRIINISSMIGRFSVPNMGLYCSSKFAIEGLSDSLRLELKDFQVSVSVIEPGVVKTPFFDTSSKTASAFPLSEEAKKVYSSFYTPQAAAFKELMVTRGAPPSEVSAAIVHAVSSTHPKTRDPVANFQGVPAWLFLTITWALPDRIRDLLFL